MLELIRQYEPDFRDFKDTIVIIDEIQEPAEIYNRIREFTRNLDISKASVNRAVNWLYSSGIIGFTGKLPECNIMDLPKHQKEPKMKYIIVTPWQPLRESVK